MVLEKSTAVNLYFPTGNLQHADIQEREDQQINRHDPDPHVLLEVTENHGHKGTAYIRGGHLQANNSCAVALAEVGQIISMRWFSVHT